MILKQEGGQNTLKRRTTADRGFMARNFQPQDDKDDDGPKVHSSWFRAVSYGADTAGSSDVSASPSEVPLRHAGPVYPT